MINNETQKSPFFTLRREGVVCLFLALTVLAVYWQVGNHEFVNYDDKDYITENQHVQAGLTLKSIAWAFTSTHAGNWHPLTWLSHMLDCQIYGLNPCGHHFTSVFFHILNSILLFLVFKRMTGAFWKSAFVAALFALHPLHVESVAWAAERKDVLSAFFWMLTMGSYIRYVERPGTNRYLLVLLFFALGLMAKPMLITLPFVLLLLDYWPLGRFHVRKPEAAQPSEEKPQKDTKSKKRKSRKRLAKNAVQAKKTTGSDYQWSLALSLLWEKIPLFVLAAASSVVTFFVQQSGGAVRSLDALPLFVRISNALVSYISYIVKMILPHNMAILYPHPKDFSIWQVAGACLLLACISFIAIRSMKRYPYFAVGWLWYLGTLVPVIGLVQVGLQSMADRYTYIPLTGIFIIIAWGISDLAAKWCYKKEWLAAATA
ncbi:MAG: glycosyltransferase family 39 protein, partial [Desulfobacterales bacterium]|nr:glycosyltransferase family 39 protein [Desulfobacterales bacterium]